MKITYVALASAVLCMTAASEGASGETAATDTDATSADAEVAQEPGSKEALIANALSAGPASVTENATVMDSEGNVLREGTNGWTCLPEGQMGAMCNDEVWMEALQSMMAGEGFPTGKFGVSYMLAGEGNTPGVSNLDPTATEPTEGNMWIKDGPHMMLILPNPAAYAEMSNDVNDPVYVMWKDTPFAHLMVRIEEADYE